MPWYDPFIQAGTNFATSFGQGLLSGASGAGTAAANNLGSLAMGGAGVALAKEAYDKLGNIGERAYTGSQNIANLGLTQTQFQPFTVRSSTGSMFGYDPLTGQANLGLSSAEQNIQNQLLNQAQQGFGATPTGFNELQQAGLAASQFGQQALGQTPGSSLFNLGQSQLGQTPGSQAMALGQQALGQIPYGLGNTQQASQQAFNLGSQFMGASQTQPADINALRGQFAGQVGGMLTQQPSSQIGQLGSQALSLGQQGLQYQGPDVSQAYSGISAPSVSGLAGNMAQQMVQAGAAERGMAIPNVSQTFAGMQAPNLRTGAGTLADRALSLGQAGLDTQAPSDVEALRQQYTQLASQTAGRALQDTADREANVYERIRATQRPEEERQRMALEERLANQGRLGVRTNLYGGTPEQAALAQAQEESQNRASLAAIQQAQSERQQAVSEAQTFGGLFGQQAGLSSELQSQAQQRATQLSQLGLSADQIQSQLNSEGFGQQLQLGQANIQAQQAQSALRTQAQQRANQLSQMGLNADQVQAQLNSEGFGQQMQLAGANLQAQQVQSGLQSQAQARAAQLAQLGLGAEQIQSQLQSEGLGRAVTSASQAAQLAQTAGGLQAQQAGLGAQFAGLGSSLAGQGQALGAAQQAQALQALQAGQGMNLAQQQAAQSAIQAGQGLNLAQQQQALAAMQAGQGLFGGALGLQGAQQQLAQNALASAYMPQAQLLNAQTASQLYPQLQQRGQLAGAGLFGEASMGGLEALLGAGLGQANLMGQLGTGLLGGVII